MAAAEEERVSHIAAHSMVAAVVAGAAAAVAAGTVAGIALGEGNLKERADILAIDIVAAVGERLQAGNAAEEAEEGTPQSGSAVAEAEEGRTSVE